MATVTPDEAGRVPARRGVFRRTLRRMMAARERQAQRYVNLHLLTLDDATLATYGIDRATLSKDIDAGYPL